ncbi:MAG TPA: hypothetical protein VK646_00055 [Actinomycetota bacterium]|nr:hypothetical protein [Actinomycetota bacterium]
MRWHARQAAFPGIALLFAFATACSGATTTVTTTASVSASTSPSVTTSPSPSTPATWRVAAPVPTWDESQTSVWDGHEVLAFGRRSVNGAPYCQDYAYAYDPSTDVWRTLPPAPGPVGCFEGGDKAVWTGNEVLLWGVTNTAYDPATNRWRHLPQPPAGAGGPSVAVWTGEQMIGWGGGCCGGAYGDGAAYTPRTNSWKLLPPSPLSPRHTTGTWTGTEMILAGGSGPEGYNGNPVFRDAAAYDPSTRTWRKLPPMPIPREGGTMVWDGTEALLVGGDSSGLAHQVRGVAFDPSTDRWRWLPPMTYPRFLDVVVWAGDQLIVWGGLREPSAADQAAGRWWAGGVPPNGESYDPATNAWSALPTAPLRGRTQASAVWTDSEVLIWGGFDARKPDASPMVVLKTAAALTPASA